jgi:acetyltransferase-like isoleucine patch superfamily enzyme
LVNKDIPPFVIAVGVPCRPIKRWHPDSNTWRPIL